MLIKRRVKDKEVRKQRHWGEEARREVRRKPIRMER